MCLRNPGDTTIHANRDLSPQARPAPRRARVIESDLLLDGEREIRIRHGDDTYRLRHTRNDKLILTK